MTATRTRKTRMTASWRARMTGGSCKQTWWSARCRSGSGLETRRSRRARLCSRCEVASNRRGPYVYRDVNGRVCAYESCDPENGWTLYEKGEALVLALIPVEQPSAGARLRHLPRTSCPQSIHFNVPFSSTTITDALVAVHFAQDGFLSSRLAFAVVRRCPRTLLDFTQRIDSRIYTARNVLLYVSCLLFLALLLNGV
jgi:hypothetical protein